MLRFLFLILLLANAAVFAWSQGWLPADLWSSAARATTEARPEIQAQRVGVLERHPLSLVAPPETPGDAAMAPGTTDTPGASLRPATASGAGLASVNRQGNSLCIEAGPFNDPEFEQVSSAVRRVLPQLTWDTIKRASPEQWSIYMGPFDTEAALERKQTELDRIPGLRYEVLRVPASLAPGISLGRHDTQEAAQQALASLKDTGVRTARVIRLRRAIERQVLRVNEADSDTQIALSGLVLPRGQTFTACRF